MSSLLEVLGTSWPLVMTHIALSVPPILLGLIIAVPIGWLANRYHLARGALLTIVGILYAIPSFPLFIALPSLLGTRILDPVNVIVALTMYAVAVMVRSAADAFSSVSGDVLQSATAVGFSGWRRFWSVEMPLAGPVMLAGLRVVSVSTVSLVTVGALVGVSSLGYLFLDGYQRDYILEIVVGIVGTVVIALIFDALIVLAARLLMPWEYADSPRARRRSAREAAAEAVVAG